MSTFVHVYIYYWLFVDIYVTSKFFYLSSSIVPLSEIISGCDDRIVQTAASVFRTMCAPGGRCNETCSGCSVKCAAGICKDDKFRSYSGAFRQVSLMI